MYPSYYSDFLFLLAASSYYDDYRWIPLDGGHRALGDALAALECVREMAAVYEREYAEREQS